MGFIRVIEIEGEKYCEGDIKSMNTAQLKMLISFIDNEKDLNWVKHWSSNNPAIEAYIDNLIAKIN